MAEIRIRGQSLDVDLESELQPFEWTRPRWSHDKLIAASPFRYDRTPSFFVTLTGDFAGCWGDSGAYDAEWAGGNFVKLLSFLRNETYEETEEYLLVAYGIDNTGDTLRLAPVRLRLRATRQALKADFLSQYERKFEYLQSRGIGEAVQRQLGVGFDRKSSAVVIPWRLPDGRLANAKFRQTRGKVFWYERDAWPIRELVFGIDQAQATTVLCEAEIDAMSFMQAGYAAVAVGGASFNEHKRDLILRSPIERLVIATDNDKAGEKLRREIIRMMSGKITLRNTYVRGDCKDANEALVKYGTEALVQAVEQSESAGGLSFRVHT